MAGPHRQRRHGTENAVAYFVLVAFVALVLVNLAGAVLLRRAYLSEEAIDTNEPAWAAIRHAVEANLNQRLLEGDPASLTKFENMAQTSVLHSLAGGFTLVEPGGRVVYSNDRAIVGTLDEVQPKYVRLLSTRGLIVKATDTDDADDQMRIASGGLLEEAQWITGPGARPLLLKIYVRSAALDYTSPRIWLLSTPGVLALFVGLELLPLPLAVYLVRRRGREIAERDLVMAADPSAADRRRIADDLHDGVLQDLAAANFGVGAAVTRLSGTNSPSLPALEVAAASTQKAIRALRTLAVEIYPPSLAHVGLDAALRDVFSQVVAHGLEGSLVIASGLCLERTAEAIIFRTAHQALRNIVQHASATRVMLTLTVADSCDLVVLEVVDNGCGFRPSDNEGVRVAPDDGPPGLRRLSDLAGGTGARLTVVSVPGAGTTVRLEVPMVAGPA